MIAVDDGRPRCRRCGRVLKTAKSIAAGIGPSCALKLKAGAGQMRWPKPKPTPKAKPRRVKEKGAVAIDPLQLSFPFWAVVVQP